MYCLDWSAKSYRGRRSKPSEMKRILSEIETSSQGRLNKPWITEWTGENEEMKFLLLPLTSKGELTVEQKRKAVHMPGIPE